MSKHKNVKNLIMNVLPDNRPVTSLQIVEDYEKCPKNFVPIHRTHDQDADADLWREINIFGKRSSRYLCLSKSEGLPEYIIETLKVCGDRELPGEGFSILSRTADTEHKAWRKRQICYRLAKRGSVTQAVTDVILCSKLKIAPDGFAMAGEINGMIVCYKTGPVTHRPPPQVPVYGADHNPTINELENSLHYMNIAMKPTNNGPANLASNGNSNGTPKSMTNDSSHYEIIRTSYQLLPPPRQAPKPSSTTTTSLINPSKYTGTLGAHTEMDGVPFKLNANFDSTQSAIFDLTRFSFSTNLSTSSNLQYDFQLERQILCTTKTPNSKNPFFACE